MKLKRNEKPAKPNYKLTQEEEDFIQDFAQEKLNELLSDPEIMAVFKRMKDR